MSATQRTRHDADTAIKILFKSNAHFVQKKGRPERSLGHTECNLTAWFSAERPVNESHHEYVESTDHLDTEHALRAASTVINKRETWVRKEMDPPF